MFNQYRYAYIYTINVTLTYEVVKLIAACKPVFETLDFREETERDPVLRFATIGAVRAYLTQTR